jgi:hypothetical protein
MSWPKDSSARRNRRALLSFGRRQSSLSAGVRALASIWVRTHGATRARPVACRTCRGKSKRQRISWRTRPTPAVCSSTSHRLADPAGPGQARAAAAPSRGPLPAGRPGRAVRQSGRPADTARIGLAEVTPDVHGGGSVTGSTRSALYAGTGFARDGVVLVTSTTGWASSGSSTFPGHPPTGACSMSSPRWAGSSRTSPPSVAHRTPWSPGGKGSYGCGHAAPRSGEPAAVATLPP